MAVAMLDYTFIFNPEHGWGDINSFEKDLVRFFEEKGLVGELTRGVDGQNNRRGVILTPRDKDPIDNVPKNQANRSVNKQLDKKGKNG